MKNYILAAWSAVLVACSPVGPDYDPPRMNLASQYAFANSTELSDIAYERWWESYNDPLLNEFMSRGLAQSIDIRRAIERIREAQAQYRAAGGGGSLAATISGDAQISSTATIGDGTNSQSDQASLGGQFVFDLFGRKARAVEEAGARAEAAEFDVRVVRLAYQFDLIGAYIDARFNQEVMAINRSSVSNRVKSLALVRDRLQANDATTLEVARAEADLSLVRALRPGLQIGFESSAIRLATLLELPSTDVIARLNQKQTGIPTAKNRYEPGVPTSLLRNRPDILAAERRLAASMAAVGVREAALYPSLSLSGTIRLATDNTLQIGPALSIPVFSRPLLKANRDAAVSRARQAELDWQDTIQTAIFEVERTLSRIKNSADEVKALRKATQDFAKLTRLQQQAYQLQSTTLLELLDAEENGSGSANQLAQARRAHATAFAELSVSIGRGARAGEILASEVAAAIQ